MQDVEVEPGVLLGEVLRLLNQRWVSASDVENVPNKMGVPDDNLAVKIFVINQILETYRKVPEQYFKEIEHRENILEAAQEALDDVIEQEEEEEGYEEDENDDGMDFDI